MPDKKKSMDEDLYLDRSWESFLIVHTRWKLIFGEGKNRKVQASLFYIQY